MAYVDNIDVGGTNYDIAAKQLSTNNHVDGVSFNGTTDIIHYGVSSTAAGTVTKTVSIADFNLSAGSHVAVKFTYADTTGTPMLNVSSTGAKTIKAYGTWKAGDVVEFEYDGTNWVASVGYLGKYDDTMAVIKITDTTITMGDVQIVVNNVNAKGDHVVFDVSALNAGMYLCTLYLNSGYYRVGDLVTGFEGTGFYSASDLLSDILTSGSTTSGEHYTMVWDQVNAQGSRLNAAASITTDTSDFGHFGSVNEDYDNPFDGIYPWSGRKLCNVDINAYYNLTPSDSITDCVTNWEEDAGFSYSDPSGVWVYTPPFYGRSYIMGNNRYFDVTDENLPNNIYYPPMITGRWHGAPVTLTVNGTSTTCNLPVLGMPYANTLLTSQHSTAAVYKGSLIDVYALDASLLLYAVEYANMNTSNTIGRGVVSLSSQNLHLSANATNTNIVTIATNANIIPGAIIDIGTTEGDYDIARTYVVSVNGTSVTLADNITATTSDYVSVHGLINVADEEIGSKTGYIGTNGKANVYYRGEVLYGNKYQYILGAYRQTNTNKIWIANSSAEAANYDSLDTNVHTDTGLALPSVATSGAYYIQTLGLCSGLSVPPFMTAEGGNATNPVGDSQYLPLLTTVNTVLLGGGGASVGNSGGGGWCTSWVFVASGASGADWRNGSRPRLLNPA